MIFAFSASTARLKRSTGAAGTRPTAPSNVSRNIGTRSTKRCAGGSDKPDNSILVFTCRDALRAKASCCYFVDAPSPK